MKEQLESETSDKLLSPKQVDTLIVFIFTCTMLFFAGFGWASIPFAFVVGPTLLKGYCYCLLIATSIDLVRVPLIGFAKITGHPNIMSFLGWTGEIGIMKTGLVFLLPIIAVYAIVVVIKDTVAKTGSSQDKILAPSLWLPYRRRN